MAIKIIERTAEDLIYEFENDGPVFRYPTGDWQKHLKVDPTPCYAHDVATVRVEAERVEALFPVGRDVTFVLTHREGLSRTNGYTDIGYIYESGTGKEKQWTATIVLHGKRIPPHPAMTRYLVAHEYGHVVREFISQKRGDGSKCAPLYEEYQKLRGFKQAANYTCGNWHARAEELFANDFRILVAGAEKEFWPHPGFARPEGVPEIVKFWEEAKKGLDGTGAQPAAAA